MALVTTKEMFKKAYDGGYAVGAFNVNNMEIIQGITEAAGELKAPVILQVSKGARAYANHTYLVKLVEAAVIENPDIPIALHLDHGDSFELCKSCIDGGFTSVMIDASSKSFEDNIALTRKVVEYAHDHGVVVEAELGTLAGVEDDVKVEHGQEMYTHPEEVEEFVTRTGCDSLAIAIGTSHGAYKFKPGQKPQLHFEVLEECSKRLPGFPIVLHGASSVPQEFVKEINQFGGNMPDAIGIPEEQLAKAAKMAVCKINIDSDIRLAMTASIRKYFAEHPDHFDPRQYLKPARAAVKAMVAHKIVDVLGWQGVIKAQKGSVVNAAGLFGYGNTKQSYASSLLLEAKKRGAAHANCIYEVFSVDIRHFSPYNFCKTAVEAAERERSNPHEEDAGTGSGTGDVPRLRCTGGRNCLGVRAWRAHARFYLYGH